MLRAVAGLWIGGKLGQIEEASLRSFIRHGHRTILYSYDRIEPTIAGLEVRDAREVWDTDAILRYNKGGSPSLHSNLFRYRLMEQTDYIWVDLDLIALRPLDFQGEYVFGYESANRVNTAVLRLPRQSQGLRELLKIGPETKGIPPHLTGMRRFKYGLRNMIAGGLGIERWPWGATGPSFLSRTLLESGEISKAQPREAFYPVSIDDLHALCDPERGTELETQVHPMLCIFGRTSFAPSSKTITVGSFLQAVLRMS